MSIKAQFTFSPWFAAFFSPADFTMFNPAALLLAVTLAISTTASPTPDPVAEGTPIPLRKRNVFTLANGVFDKDKAHAATAATINKHSQNLKNLVKNLGPKALPKVSSSRVPC
jgi:cathepsin D